MATTRIQEVWVDTLASIPIFAILLFCIGSPAELEANKRMIRIAILMFSSYCILRKRFASNFPNVFPATRVVAGRREKEYIMVLTLVLLFYMASPIERMAHLKMTTVATVLFSIYYFLRKPIREKLSPTAESIDNVISTGDHWWSTVYVELKNRNNN